METEKLITEVENNIANMLIDFLNTNFSFDCEYNISKFGNSVIIESSYILIDFQIINKKIIHIQKFNFKNNFCPRSLATYCLEQLDDMISESSNFFGLKEGGILIF